MVKYKELKNLDPKYDFLIEQIRNRGGIYNNVWYDKIPSIWDFEGKGWFFKTVAHFKVKFK